MRYLVSTVSPPTMAITLGKHSFNAYNVAEYNAERRSDAYGWN